MRSPTDAGRLRRAVMISMLASVAIVLGLVEALIPFAVSVPGAKLGLGNIIVIVCLYAFSGKDAWTLIMLKTVITAFIFGSFSTFLFSLFGAAFSFVVMWAMLGIGKAQFSLVGVSVAGGIMHNAGQLAAASIVLGTTKIMYYLPFLLVSGIATGVIVGIAAKQLIASLGKMGLAEFEGLRV